MKSVNLLHKWGFGDSDTNSTVSRTYVVNLCTVIKFDSSTTVGFYKCLWTLSAIEKVIMKQFVLACPKTRNSA